MSSKSNSSDEHARWLALRDRFKQNPKSITKAELRALLFIGDKPRCQFCGHPMRNYTPAHGRFKGKLQKYEWVCDCPPFVKTGMVLSAG